MEKEKVFYPDNANTLTTRINSLLADIAGDNVIEINIQERHKMYESAKRELNQICGWCAQPKDYNRALYDQTIKRIINLLGI